MIENSADEQKPRRKRKQKSVAELTEEDVRKIRMDGRTLNAIAKDHGIKSIEVRHVKERKLWGWLPGDVVFGHRPKLTPEQVVAIRKDPRPQKMIAEAYGIGMNAVWYVKKKLTYPSVPDELPSKEDSWSSE